MKCPRCKQGDPEPELTSSSDNDERTMDWILSAAGDNSPGPSRDAEQPGAFPGARTR